MQIFYWFYVFNYPILWNCEIKNICYLTFIKLTFFLFLNQYIWRKTVSFYMHLLEISVAYFKSQSKFLYSNFCVCLIFRINFSKSIPQILYCTYIIIIYYNIIYIILYYIILYYIILYYIIIILYYIILYYIILYYIIL